MGIAFAARRLAVLKTCCCNLVSVIAVAIPGIGMTACDDRGSGDARQVGGLARMDSAEFDGQVPTLSDRPSTDTLSFVRFVGSDDDFGIIGVLKTTHEYLVVGDWQVSPHIIVFDLQSARQVARFGQQGSGPQEFRRPLWFDVDIEQNVVRAYDQQNGRLTILGVDGRPHIVDEFPFHADGNVSAPVVLGDTVMAGGMFQHGPLAIYGLDGRRLGNPAVEQPFGEDDVAAVTPRMMTNLSFVAIDDQRTRIAAAYRHASRIDFFTIQGVLYGSVDGPRPTTPRFRVSRNGQMAVFDSVHQGAYTSIDATNELVAALFSGYPHGEGRHPTRIHFFDWRGNFVAEVALPMPAYRIALSRDGGRVYAAVRDPVPRVAELALDLDSPRTVSNEQE